MQFQQNVPLAPLTTLGVGGPSRWFVAVSGEDELRQAVEWARECSLPIFILGGGSNLVVADSGWPGLTIHIAMKGVRRGSHDGKEMFEVASGEDWDSLVAAAVAANCAGLECLSGIPGTVGGTPVQNVGAYGQEVSETISHVRALDLSTLEISEFSNEQCGFAYRTSRFNTTERGRYVITRVTYALTPGGSPKIAYADLRKYFGEQPSPTLSEVREAVRAIRHKKAMLIVEGDEDSRSAGSFFKNPVVEPSTYDRIANEVSSAGLVPPKYPAVDGRVKMAAAWLVEQSGVVKGFTYGRVGISRRHSLAIVNRGGATAAEVLALANLVQQRVRDRFGINLQPEPVFLGF